MMDIERSEAIKASKDRTEKYQLYLSQAIGGYRGLCEMMDSQLNREEIKIDRLEASNAELLEALKNLVEVDRRDNTTDPDVIASERWRHEAWGIAYSIVGEDELEVE